MNGSEKVCQSGCQYVKGGTQMKELLHEMHVWMNDYMYANAINQLPSWVEYIMTKATDSFKQNPQVKAFYTDFLQAQKEMNGTAEPAAEAAPATGTTPDAVAAPPTPAQMAGDSISR